MSDVALMVEVHPGEHALTARVPIEPARVLGLIPATVHSTEPITEAIRRLTGSGLWSLWITDPQVRIAGLGRPKDYPSPAKRYRRVPLTREWLGSHGMGELTSGDHFFLTRDGDATPEVGFLRDDAFRWEPEVRQLPEGATAFIAFDPDLQWFDAVFSGELFDEAVALVRGVAQEA